MLIVDSIEHQLSSRRSNNGTALGMSNLDMSLQQDINRDGATIRGASEKRTRSRLIDPLETQTR